MAQARDDSCMKGILKAFKGPFKGLLRAFLQAFKMPPRRTTRDLQRPLKSLSERGLS